MQITKSSPKRESVRLVWTDLEMSGLDPDRDKVLEAAFIITDGNLREIAASPSWVFHQPDSVLNEMDEWNRTTHAKTGLTEECRKSSLTEAAGEEEILSFLGAHVRRGESPMCGNSIGQDRRFMARHLPRVEAFFHYRNLDVSSFKIAAFLYMPAALNFSKGKSVHRGMDDIRDSIDEMRRYARALWPDISDIADPSK